MADGYREKKKRQTKCNLHEVEQSTQKPAKPNYEIISKLFLQLLDGNLKSNVLSVQ